MHDTTYYTVYNWGMYQIYKNPNFVVIVKGLSAEKENKRSKILH